MPTLEEYTEVDLSAVKSACAELMRQFDSVQIFATRHEGESGTVSIQFGQGNWFARYGHVRRWVEVESPEPVSEDNSPEEDL